MRSSFAVKSVLENSDDLGLSRFREYLALANLESSLDGTGVYTLFVPTNEAWDGKSNLIKMFQIKHQLIDINFTTNLCHLLQRVSFISKSCLKSRIREFRIPTNDPQCTGAQTQIP